MKRISLYLAGALFLIFVACKQNTSSTKETGTDAIKSETPLNDHHTAETSLDYAGIYEGTIPAASGPGIKIRLTINKDKTFAMVSDYIDEKDAVFTDKGTYSIEGNYITLTEKDNPPRYLKVEEGQVRMLDADKQVVTGELGEHYILKQIKVF